MVVYDRIPEKILEKYNNWRGERDTFLKYFNKDKDYYNSDIENTRTRFTVEQLNQIKSKHGLNIPLSINHIYHLLEQKLAILMQAKPTFKIEPLDERGKSFAYILEKIVRHIMYQSSSIGEEEECIKNMLIGGIGITGIIEKPSYQLGHFNLEYINIDLNTIILDANARKRDMSDMRGYFIEKEITKEEAKEYYSGILELINLYKITDEAITFDNLGYNFNGTSQLPARGYLETLNLKEYYDYIYTTMYIYQDLTGEIKREFEENLLPEQFGLIKPLIVDKEYNRFVRKWTILNDRVIDITIKPITAFPLSIKFFNWGGFPYKSYGAVHYIRDMQDAYDRILHTFIINGILQNNATYVSPSTSIPDPLRKNWEELGNTPGIIKEFVPYIQGNTVVLPQREQISDLSSFYPTILQILRADMESSTGINPIVQGNPQESKIDVFSTAQQYQNSAMMRIQLNMQHINLANEKLANVLVEYLLANLSKEQKYIFYDSDSEGFNELQISEEIQKVKYAKYLVLGIPSESTPTERSAIVTQLMNISQSTSDPVQRDVYLQQAFKYANIKGFDELKNKMDTTNQLRQQIASLQEELKRTMEISKQFENRAERSETTAKVTEATYKELIPIMMEAAKIEKDIEIEKINEKLKRVSKGVDK